MSKMFTTQLGEEKQTQERKSAMIIYIFLYLPGTLMQQLCGTSSEKSILQMKYHWKTLLISALASVRSCNVSMNNVQLQSLLQPFQTDEQFLKSYCGRCTFASSSKTYKNEIYCSIYCNVLQMFMVIQYRCFFFSVALTFKSDDVRSPRFYDSLTQNTLQLLY